MPLIEPDFSELAEITPGTYKAHIVGAKEVDTQTGKKMIKWDMSVFDCADSRLNGKHVWMNTMHTGPGAFRYKQLVEAVFGKGANGRRDTEEFAGKTLLITVIDGLDRNTGAPTGFVEVKAVQALAA